MHKHPAPFGIKIRYFSIASSLLLSNPIVATTDPFNDIIPIDYIASRKKHLIYINLAELNNKEVFTSKIIIGVPKNIIY